MKKLLTFLLLLVSANLITAQMKAPLQPLAFLSGRWAGDDVNGHSEEYWSPIHDNSMVGTFRIVKDGKAVFYEFWAIEVEDGKPVYKLKHFNSGLKGWEEKNEMVRLPMTESGPNRVMFSNTDGSLSLVYARSGDTLIANLHHVKNGKPEDETFEFHREH